MQFNPKLCWNCGGSDLYSKEVSANGGDGPALLPLGIFSFAKFRVQVCGDCGHVEWFVPSRYLPKVKEKFTREGADALSIHAEAIPPAAVGMSDGLKNRGPADRARVNVDEEWERRWWCLHYGVNEERLK